MPSVQLDSVSFSYPVYHLTGRSFKVTLMRQMVGSPISTASGVVMVDALSDVSFKLGSGDP